MENDPTMLRKILKNKVIQKFNMKENRCNNFSVSTNHPQGLEKCYEVLLDHRWMLNEIQNKTKGEIVYTEKVVGALTVWSISHISKISCDCVR